MGPRLCRRGKGHEARKQRLDPLLQWGHAFAGVESILRIVRDQRYVGLQWGHAFAGVESTSV